MSSLKKETKTMTAAEALLTRLAHVGIDYVFVNSGTDYPPVIEAIAKAQAEGSELPGFVTCPHESAAVGMAQGYYYATGRGQAVMTHTNVGLANAICGLINSCNENVPTFLMTGRTPITEKGRIGTRSTPINYGQEMRDQNALVRESVKWDYEIRVPEQTPDLVDRAYAIAHSQPRGPVFLGLPREPLCETFEAPVNSAPSPLKPVVHAPDATEVARAAELISKAKRPVILAQRGAGSDEGFDLLSRFANTYGIPVVEFWALRVAISCDDPMAAGPNLAPWLKDADLVIVLDSQAPWMPDHINPPEDCPVIQIGPDPLFEKYPVRSFANDVSLSSDVDIALSALLTALESQFGSDLPAEIVTRRKAVAKRNAETQAQLKETAKAGSADKINKPGLSKCLGDISEKHKGRIVSELVGLKEFTGLTRPNTYFQEAIAGGLGHAFSIALGMKLAHPEELITVAMGDGSYMFSNPVVCHQISMANNLPLLIVVGNNSEWGAVRGGVVGMYPEGFAAKANKVPLTSLDPAPDFCGIAKAAGAHAVKVTNGQELNAALEEGANIVLHEKRTAFVEVILG